MKKSQIVSLVLITSALASCHKDPSPQQKVYMRSDSTAAYCHSDYHYHSHGTLLWYYAFRPYGMYNGGIYHRVGYYSGGISEHANIGVSTAKSGIVRGGFGGRGFSVSS